MSALPSHNGHQPPAGDGDQVHRAAIAALSHTLAGAEADTDADAAGADEPLAASPPSPASPAASSGRRVPRPLADWWDDPDPGPEATLVPVDRDGGGPGLVYPGMSHLLAAPGGSGKTWLALAMALEVLEQVPDRPVLLLDYEASAPVTVHRLRQFGATLEQAQRLVYLPLDTPLAAEADILAPWVAQHRPALAVVDAVTPATALAGVDSDRDNAGYIRWHRGTEALVGADGTAEGCALVLIDHISTKTSDAQLLPRGATSKVDGVTGAAYALVMDAPLSASQQGRGRLLVAKDRHARGRGDTAARVTLTPQPEPGDGQAHSTALRVAFTPPGHRDAAVDAQPREDRVAAAIREQLAAQSLSRRQLCRAVPGDDTTVRAVVDRMRAGGELVDDTSQPARGGAHPLTLAPGAATPPGDDVGTDDGEEPF